MFCGGALRKVRVILSQRILHGRSVSTGSPYYFIWNSDYFFENRIKYEKCIYQKIVHLGVYVSVDSYMFEGTHVNPK